ncbi:riboflavin synthase [Candidatus Uhrbacteria bacterium]|nr:riboflavin synthase [Candidatus Uhrbacteria bacterium]
MFTGIITNLGRVARIEKDEYQFSVAEALCNKIALGSSISVNGVCLTVKEVLQDRRFSVDLMPETLKKTALGSLQKSDEVNLELPATPSTFLSGHIVQGHVDGVGEIESITKEGNSRLFRINAPQNLTRYIIPKGSIAVNGISLTVIGVEDQGFSVGIIPYTWEHTMLHAARVRSTVNIEVDVIAKYVEKFV